MTTEYGYHCTTPKKLERYKSSGRIIAPVRYFPSRLTADKWAKKTGRFVIKIRLDSTSYPLPDHKPARWCGRDVIEFDC